MADVLIDFERFEMKLYQNTWLYFHLLNAKGNEFLEYNLPAPNYLLHSNLGVFIGWLIKGYPGTKEAREYFNDIIARFLIGFKEYKPERLPYRPNLTREAFTHLKQAYDLKLFQNLPSLYWANKKNIWTATDSIEKIDQTFWAIKVYTEELIKEFGEGIPVPYELLEDFAIRNFYDRKDKSTLKAKCRSIWNWYDNRNWTIPKRKEWQMTRSERAKENAKLKKQRARAVLLGFIQNNLLADEYKKTDGTWNIKELSKAIGLHRNTISKHLKELQEEGKIK